MFLEEAREVVVNGTTAIAALIEEPGNLSEQTTLRRAFHTLKGSSRMVGLNDFGEAAWAMEQLLNAWLAEQKPMQPPLLQLSSDALQAFDRWASDIAAGQTSGWQSQAFRESADALRLQGQWFRWWCLVVSKLQKQKLQSLQRKRMWSQPLRLDRTGRSNRHL